MTQPERRETLLPAWLLVGAFLGLLLARMLGAHFLAFFGLDEISLADGVAALSRGSIASIYRYGPQVGYYRLAQAITFLLGGDLRLIPQIIIVLSALASALIPFFGLLAFRDELSRSERLVLAGVLVVNPILWMSSSYGNSAMPSTALLIAALAILSNRPRRGAEAGALLIFGAAVLVRADAVLATPIVAWLLYLRYRALGPVVSRIALFAAPLAAVYALLFLADPHMANTVGTVVEHLTNERFQTMFWEYLLWSTSPFLLLAAVMGAERLLQGRRELLLGLVLWCLPFFAFYYASTTQPRYFLPTAFPVAILSSVGLVGIAQAFHSTRRRVAALLLGALSSAHLFVGLGHFAPGSLRNLLLQSQFETHIGPLWTGAYLYKSYFDPSFLERSLRHDGFGRGSPVQRAFDSSLAVQAGTTEPGKTVVLLDGWNGHVFHYYALVHGAHYTSVAPGPPFNTETWMTLGPGRLMSIARKYRGYDSLPRLPLDAGDRVWVLRPTLEAESVLRAKLPPGVTLSVSDSTPPLRRYRVERAP